MGTGSTPRRARTSLWWPGMNNQLKQFIATCEIPNRPWSKVGSDIFELNKEHYLVLVDYYSDWIEFDFMKNQTASETINLMQKVLAILPTKEE